MLNQITGYFKELAGFLIFSGILSACAPDRFKKYVLLSAGFVVILIALRPLKALQTHDYGDQDAAVIAAFAQAGALGETPERPATRQALARQIEGQYVLTLSERLSDKINADSPDFAFVNARFDIDADIDGDTFGAIKSITVRVTPKGAKRTETPRPFIYVEKVEIAITPEPRNDEPNEAEDAPEVTRLKILISDFYNVSKPHINILVGAD